MTDLDVLDANIANALQRLPRSGRVLFRLGLRQIGRAGDRLPREALARKLGGLTPPTTPAETIAVLALARSAIRRFPDDWAEIVPPPPAGWLEQYGVEL